MNQEAKQTSRASLSSEAEIESLRKLLDLQCSRMPAELKKRLMAAQMKQHVGLVLGGSQ